MKISTINKRFLRILIFLQSIIKYQLLIDCRKVNDKLERSREIKLFLSFIT